DFKNFQSDEIRSHIKNKYDDKKIKNFLKRLRDSYINLVIIYQNIEIIRLLHKLERNLISSKECENMPVLCNLQLIDFSVTRSLSLSLFSIYENDGINIKEIINFIIKNNNELKDDNEIYIEKLIETHESKKHLSDQIEILRKFRNNCLAHNDISDNENIKFPVYDDIFKATDHTLSYTLNCMKILTTRKIDTMEDFFEKSKIRIREFEKFLKKYPLQ
ncbi:hypothetical protein, partial [Bifidobacterium tibiigranuli]